MHGELMENGINQSLDSVPCGSARFCLTRYQWIREMLVLSRCQWFEDRINLTHKVSETLLGNIVDRPIRPAAGITHRDINSRS